MKSVFDVGTIFRKGLLEGDRQLPKHRRLYYGLRDAILQGRLGVGDSLPSTRTVAAELGLSRNTVSAAFDQLVAEGFVESRVGSGSYVAYGLMPIERQTTGIRGERALRSDPTPSLSVRGKLLASQCVRAGDYEARLRPFRSGTPALDEFPFGLWARLGTQCIKQASRDLFMYAEPAGQRALREAVAAYLATARAVRCRPEQVLITIGSQQALDLTARLLLEPGDCVWVEDPGYRGARAALAGNGARLIGVPLDEGGIDIEAGRRREPRPRLIYVTPSSQFPMGMTMSLERRLALLAFARRVGTWIFEDDYDSEFRYNGRPIAALQGLDDGGRVIYAGTFSKVLFPGLRLGYVVVPAHVADGFINARSVSNRQPSTIDQAVVTRFLTDGHFARHLRRMRELYKERQAVLVDEAARQLRGLLDVRARETGMQLVGLLPAGRDDVTLAKRAFELRIDVAPLSTYFLDKPTARGFVLGYTAETSAEIRDGVRRLRQALM